MDETSYEDGRRSAWADMLSYAVGELGPERSPEAWRLERARAVAQLRDLCGEFGDNDWDSDLRLEDIIDKHLGKYLHARAANEANNRTNDG